jgi:hypothetical protein
MKTNDMANLKKVFTTPSPLKPPQAKKLTPRSAFALTLRPLRLCSEKNLQTIKL